MEHFITEIKINRLRHLSDIVISLNPGQRQHLILTGKNGSGKTSLLDALKVILLVADRLVSVNDHFISEITDADGKLLQAKFETKAIDEWKYKRVLMGNKYTPNADGVSLAFNNYKGTAYAFYMKNFVTSYFPADRKVKIDRFSGVEDIRLDSFYGIDSKPGELLHKYLVHLKTQQSYARNEDDMAVVNRIKKWFERFEHALRVLLDDSSISLVYDYKNYDFKIHQAGRQPFGFEELSDGYSAAVQIVSDLILRMDKNWLLSDRLSEYDFEGIVLIDEVETHLHIELQKKILPFLTEFFPRIQFIVTTHSPYVLNSISNAKVFDLERRVELEDLSMYSSDSLAEGYFGADEYSDKLKQMLERYVLLNEKSGLSEEERAERAKLRSELKNIPRGLSPEAADKFYDAKEQQI